MSTTSLGSAELIALMSVGCTASGSAVKDASGNWTVNAGGKVVKISASGDASVQ
jgi:hypothetical protein